jgi:hypothetical protein
MNNPSVSTATPDDDPTPTQKIWNPIADLDKQQQQAFVEFANATLAGDIGRATQAKRLIDSIEQQQKVAHQAARAYLLQKLQR